MNVKELKALLTQVPDDTEILLSTPGDSDFEYALADAEIDEAKEYVILSGDIIAMRYLAAAVRDPDKEED